MGDKDMIIIDTSKLDKAFKQLGDKSYEVLNKAGDSFEELAARLVEVAQMMKLCDWMPLHQEDQSISKNGGE